MLLVEPSGNQEKNKEKTDFTYSWFSCRDAWKKLEGMSELEAKHRYVEILLQVAMEAYKKPAGRAQAHQIIQSFAVMQPSGESGDSSSEEEDEDDSSADGSVDAEELAYLRQVEKSIPGRPPTSSSRQWRGGASSRASSTGQMSMRTAPTEFRSSSSRSVDLRPMTTSRARSSRVYDENFDDSVNPWVLHPSARQPQFHHIPNRPSIVQQDAYRSPMSTSSSVTATQYNNSSMVNERSGPSDQHVLLGPATKRAIESLQQEIETLNERIHGLRKEMVDRDNKRLIPVKKSSSTSSSSSSSTPEDGWKWVIKAAVKHAILNLMTGSILFLVLYKTKSPIAHVIIQMIGRFWQRFKLYILMSKAVV
ncbi:uncharacterized protein EV154DRAFT_421807 [Mucor mucedo]|uniref:uncharacterized protein n=1 Tax=Mucor mucedo TaxID=29922 RepID=UPI00221E72D3|nr:uncharacterized protein EV154DRAFT_421807 [Mucor mucedo]KAI7890627.1 hypothetical protein EV154DRAFT_421807 [Mucor mucedo]